LYLKLNNNKRICVKNVRISKKKKKVIRKSRWSARFNRKFSKWSVVLKRLRTTVIYRQDSWHVKRERRIHVRILWFDLHARPTIRRADIEFSNIYSIVNETVIITYSFRHALFIYRASHVYIRVYGFVQVVCLRLYSMHENKNTHTYYTEQYTSYL